MTTVILYIAVFFSNINTGHSIKIVQFIYILFSENVY